MSLLPPNPWIGTPERLQSKLDELGAEVDSLRAILRAVPDLMFLLDADGRYRRVWARDPGLLLGHEELLLDRRVAEVMPAEAAAAVEAAIAETLVLGQSSGHVLQLEVPAGLRYFELSTSLAPAVADGGRQVVMLSRDVTSRVEAEAAQADARRAAEAAAQLAQQTMDALQHPICVVDVNGTVIASNRAFQGWGPERGGLYRSDPAPPATLGPLVPPNCAIAQTLQANIQQVASGAIPSTQMETRCPFSAGVRWLELQITALADAGLAKAVVVHQDVTERRQLERRLRQAVTQANLGHWELDLKSQRLWWSDEIYSIFEVDRQKFGASYGTFLAAVHPEDRQRVDQAFQFSLETRAPYAITHRLLMPDGRIKHVEERCETDYLDDGTAHLARGTAQDVTNLVRTQQRLAEASRAASLGAWEVDLESGELWWSDEQYLIHGLTPGTLIAQEAFLAAVHPDDRAGFRAAFSQVLVAGTGTMDYRIVRPDGAVRFLRGTACVVRSEAGTPLRMSGTNQDLTEVRQAASAFPALHPAPG